MCKHDPRCKARKLRDPSGNVITDHSEFLARAAELLAVYSWKPQSVVLPEDTARFNARFGYAHRIREDWEAATYLRHGGMLDDTLPPPKDTIVLDRFRLCGDHSRQLARGTIAALHYCLCFPDSPAPTPELTWAVGSLSDGFERWFFPVVVALFRAHGLGVAEQREINRSLDGVREYRRRDVRPVDDGAAEHLLWPISNLGFMLDSKPKGEEPAQELGKVIEGYTSDNVELLCWVAEYFNLWSKVSRLPGPKPTTGTPPNAPPSREPREWFRQGF